MAYNISERAGVHAVAKIFFENFKWIFREQPINDFGIDGYVEMANLMNKNNLRPTGKIIGVQIKTGNSYFRESTIRHFVFRGSRRHLEYWLNHSLSVIVILYNNETNCAYWQEITISTVTLTKNNFKINIPRTNTLSTRSKEELTRIGHFKNQYDFKLWHLRSSTEIINRIVQQQLFLYTEIESIPGSNDYHISLVITQEEDENCAKVIYGYNDDAHYYSLLLSDDNNIAEGISDVIPWADLYYNDRKFVDEMLIETIANDIMSFSEPELTEEILQLKEHKYCLAMACCLCGNYCFRLELKANNFALNFLMINEYLEKDTVTKQRIFI
ncbi:MAG: hypothetical protein K0Q79_565 [Flavipsychrobacter sp.]|jgi:hypothetical protein|nr:hypothetical protein [Flavipsychrobacter sp.]